MPGRDTIEIKEEAIKGAQIESRLGGIEAKLEDVLNEVRGHGTRLASAELKLAVLRTEVDYLKKAPRIVALVAALLGGIGGGGYYLSRPSRQAMEVGK